MSNIIEFLIGDYKIEKDIYCIVNNLKELLNIEIYELDLADEINNQQVFQINFKTDYEYIVEFETQTYNLSLNKKNINVKIYFELEKFSHTELEQLKINLKNIMMDDAKVCYWLEDECNVFLSKELYEKINKTETKLRKFIYQVLYIHIGEDWWNEYKSEKFIRKIEERKLRLKSYENVETFMNGLDIIDFNEITQLKAAKYCVEEKDIDIQSKIKEYSAILKSTNINKDVKSETTNKLLEVIDSTKKSGEIKLGSYIYKYLDSTFTSKLAELSTHRNTIMHNKLIDLEVYNKINDCVNDVNKCLDNAIESMKIDIPTLEDSQSLKEKQLLEQKNYEQLFAEEAGITINTRTSIIDVYNEKIIENIHNIFVDLMYIDQIELKINYISEDSGKIIEIYDKIHKTNFVIKYEIDINENRGENSILTLFANSEELKISERCDVEYYNADYEYDEENANYKISDSEYLNDEAYYELEIKLIEFKKIYYD